MSGSPGTASGGDAAHAELDIRAYAQILWRRKWIIALATIIVFGVAMASTLSKTKLYRASTEILVARSAAETYFDPLRGAYVDPERVLSNQIRVIQSERLSNLVADRLGYSAGVSASAAETEDVITLTATDTDPARAAKVVNTYAQTYIEYRLESERGGTEAARQELQRQIDTLQAEVDALDRSTDGTPASAARQQEVALQRQQLVSQISDIRAQLTQLQASANVARGGAEILREAVPPSQPFDPNPRRTGTLALAVGLMLGVGLAFLIDFLDDRIRTKADLERASGGLSVLGLIPAVRTWKSQDKPELVSLATPDAHASEAYRSLRTSIQFMGLDRPIRLLQVTSPAASEGKTTTLANLAVALSSVGQRVIVVCCDLRKPRVHEFFGVDNRVGFTSVLLGDVPLASALQPVTGSNLRILASGPEPPNPSELLSGRRAVELLHALQAEADIVLVDSPPVLPVSDAAVLATRVDGTLIVTNANDTTKKQLHRALELLEQVDANVIGTVLNGAGDDTTAYGYGYYGYGRGRKTPSSDRHQRTEAARS